MKASWYKLAALLSIAWAGNICGAIQKSEPVYFYASEFSLPGIEMDCAAPTIEAIRKAIAPRELRVVQLTSIKEVDKVFGMPGQFVAVVGASTYWRHLRDGIRDIATLVSHHQSDPDHAVGALVVVRKNSPIKTLDDLEGHSIAVNEPNGFQAIQVVYREIADAGHEWRGFFSNVKSYGLDFRQRLEAVRNGEVDAATVNVCYAERMAAKGIDVLKDLKPLSIKRQKSVSCMTSTKLYPNWSLLASPELDSSTRVKIANAVYAMQPVSDGQRWTMASDFRETDELYRVLKTGPYAYLNQWTLRRIWEEYRLAVLCALAAIAFFLWHSWRTSQIVVVKTAQLREALERQKQLSQYAIDVSRRYEKTRRALTITQLSSMVAHELSQPLSGILLYSQGIRQLVCTALPISQQRVALDVLAKIEARARKANNIVNYVRSYAKSNELPFNEIDLLSIVKTSVDNMVIAGKMSEKAFQVNCRYKYIWILGSQLELELALNNIIENSIQAIGKSCRINIDLSVSSQSVHLDVSDNGQNVDNTLLQSLSEPLSTSKKEGLGLGLSLVRCIVDRHAGTVTFSNTKQGGLRITMKFPVLRKK